MTLRGLVLTGMAAVLALPAAASGQAPPINDNYLSSVPFNESGRAGDPPPAGQELEHNVDTTFATEQADLFNPPQAGGPPETLACEGVPFGKTVWYDVYPDRDGTLRVLSVGAFDPVIAIYGFRPGNPVPNLDEAACVNARSGPTEELIVEIARGRAYTIQIGGVGGAGGAHQGTFGFFPKAAERLRATATMRARATPTGIRVRSLRVNAPRGARVRVSCTRRGCKTQARTAAAARTLTSPIGAVGPAGAKAASPAGPRAEMSRTVTFTNVRNRRLRSGQSIEIRVTRRGAIGRYITYRVVRGNFRKTERCMNPGSTKPRRRCSG